MRSVLLLLVAVTLSACGSHASYSELIARSHAEHERAELSGEIAAKPLLSDSKPKTRAVRAVVAHDVSTSGSSAPSPEKPAAHASAADQEDAEAARIDKQLKGKLNICRGC